MAEISDSFAGRVLDWFQTNRRDLPWRRNRDPYRIWISEIMLQQTQVKTVVPYFERFMSRFPDVDALARAKESEVVAQWSGLGYYSRARNLHRAAQRIAANHCEFPQEFDQILDLPGIGRYTAGAIASIAFDAVCPVVDGNVRRFLARFHGKAFSEAECWQKAAALLPERRTGEYNQALMEIGATVCRPEQPLCHECPVQQACASSGGPFPDLRKQVQPVARSMTLLLLGRRGKFWIEERGPAEELLKNLWCFPLLAGGKFKGKLLRRMLQRYAIENFQDHGTFRHSIMRFRFKVNVLSATASKTPTYAGLWASETELKRYPHSSLVEKTLKLVLNSRDFE